METQVRTPQMVFMQPQRLVVPLFQRPYVWNEENQWEPLWNDVVRVAERLLDRPDGKHAPALPRRRRACSRSRSRRAYAGANHHRRPAAPDHAAAAAGRSACRAAGGRGHGASSAASSRSSAMLSRSARDPEDRFKVWPTNRDRPAFNAVMARRPPVDYDALGYRRRANGRGASVLQRPGTSVACAERAATMSRRGRGYRDGQP